MGKIIQIKEEQIVNGGSNIPIYPITTAKATYYKDGKHIQKKIEETESGEILNDSAIITRHIKNQNVTEDKIRDTDVTTKKIRDRNVTTEKIAEEGVTSTELAPDSVITKKIADNNVTTEKIGSGQVQTRNIKDQNITTSKIKDSNVTTEKIADYNITESKIADSNVTTQKIKDEAVTFNKLDKATRDIIKSATGTPEDLIEDLDKLMKKVFPAEVSCNFTPTSLQEKGTTCTVTINDFKATVDGKEAVITCKTVNDTIVEETEYTEQINDSKSFTIIIDAEGRTSTINKSVTFVYPIFTGFNSATEFTESLAESLTKLGLRSSLGTITDTKTNTSTSNYYWIVSPYKVNNVVTSGINIISDFIYTTVEYRETTYHCYRLNASSSTDTFTFTIS